ncbi:helix-turn-helix domain-containing protein [Labilithrix luteola]|uniref:helix-turn-helix domain-containing protein n=1 Tax=Labilithrix luteola TaxID=1391654 RepID=UPI001F0AD2AE
MLTVEDAATLLRTSRKAVYALIERGALPGVVRVGRRVLFRAVALRKHLGLTTVSNPVDSLTLGNATGSKGSR